MRSVSQVHYFYFVRVFRYKMHRRDCRKLDYLYPQNEYATTRICICLYSKHERGFREIQKDYDKYLSELNKTRCVLFALLKRLTDREDIAKDVAWFYFGVPYTGKSISNTSFDSVKKKKRPVKIYEEHPLFFYGSLIAFAGALIKHAIVSLF